MVRKTVLQIHHGPDGGCSSTVITARSGVSAFEKLSVNALPYGLRSADVRRSTVHGPCP